LATILLLPLFCWHSWWWASTAPQQAAYIGFALPNAPLLSKLERPSEDRWAVEVEPTHVGEGSSSLAHARYISLVSLKKWVGWAGPIGGGSLYFAFMRALRCRGSGSY
jgi:hypothetical protein